MTDAVRRYWDSQARNFDVEADHGLADPTVRQAWEDLLLPLMPMPGCDVADLGCGTGSLSLLLGEAGHQVWGVDLSGQMVARARTKLANAGVSADFVWAMRRHHRVRMALLTLSLPGMCCGPSRILTPRWLGGPDCCGLLAP
jgi:ubiquinone/menaquinone biosynthesis C-methylase UbiE